MSAKVSPEAVQTLKTLELGYCHYVAACEMTVFAELENTAYVNAWMSSGNVPMWHITRAGLAFLASLQPVEA